MTPAEIIAILEQWSANHAALCAQLQAVLTDLEAADIRPLAGGRPSTWSFGIVKRPDGWHVFASVGSEDITFEGPPGATPAAAVLAVSPAVQAKLDQLQTRVSKWQIRAAAVRGL